MRAIVDSDQHLYEYRGMWEEHIDPALRGEALRFVDDDLGHTWMMWRDQRIAIADVQRPGQIDAVGEHFRRAMDGLPACERYDDVLPQHYWEPKARMAYLDELRVAEAFLFPNYGLLWERTLDEVPGALKANLTAWNRWCATVSAEGGGRLHPVAHVTLRDLDWLERELRTLSAAGVRLAMVAPALVDGKPLSHPDVDRAWSAFVTHGVTPIFHVADQRRPFADAWYTDTGQAFVPTLESVFLWTGAALATADLIINGVFERHPELRLGIVELSAMWVGQYLMMLDGATQFTSRINGRVPAQLSMSPSDYFRRHVRVSSFAYEEPAFLRKQLDADLFMCGSDYPHSEGTATPVADYTNSVAVADAPGLFGDNADFLLRR
jgi:predicted TIM-barrel fold metal-dependent hydrolase